MTNTNFALTFIDSDGIEQIINSSGDIVLFNGSVLFSSFENADKAQKKLKKLIQKQYLALHKYWHDEAISNPDRFVNPGEGDRYIRKYKDICLIDSNGIEIKEVTLSF